jgi:DNA-3-methyladenine glycosylase
VSLSEALPRSFYARSAEVVARALLGQRLVVRHGRASRVGRIVETEAYLGPHDLACHSSKGRTARTEVMFGPGGFAYVYLIYGMYDCFNVVTGKGGEGAAVLVRAVEPLAGIDGATDGPGKLTRAMGIDRALGGRDLTVGRRVWLAEGAPLADHEVERGPRIGVDYAGAWAEAPLRFFAAASPFVSRRPRPRRAAS